MDEALLNTFQAKLQAVMAHFSLSSAALAQALSIEPFVLDAWLDGEQRVYPNAEALQKIADYFSGRALTLRDINWFYKQFQLSGLALTVITAADMRPLLTNWFGADLPGEDTARARAGDAPLPSLPQTTAASSSTGFFERASAEDFSVKAGLPNLALYLDRLFDNLPPGSDLHIHLSCNTMYSITDPAIVSRLIHYTRSLALQVRLLVPISDNASTLPGLIALYLPLLTSGAMRVYVMDSLSQPLTNQICFQAGARHALLITEAEKASSPPVSMLISEDRALLDLQKTFEQALRYARPLFANYDDSHAATLHETLQSEYAHSGDLDIVSDCPLPLFMPEEAYMAHLVACGLSDEAQEEKRAAFLQTQGAMDEALGGGAVLRIILRLSRLKQILQEGKCRLPGYLLLQDGIATMNAAALAASLEGMVDYLTKFPDSIHLYITNNTEPFIEGNCWHMKRNHHSCIASLAQDTPGVLYTDEPALAHAFLARFHALWQNGTKVLGSRERTVLTVVEAVRLLRQRF